MDLNSILNIVTRNRLYPLEEKADEVQEKIRKENKEIQQESKKERATIEAEYQRMQQETLEMQQKMMEMQQRMLEMQQKMLEMQQEQLQLQQKLVQLQMQNQSWSIQYQQELHRRPDIITRGGKLVDPSPELEKESKTELEIHECQFVGGAGVDMTSFPFFKFEEPKLVAPIEVSGKLVDPSPEFEKESKTELEIHERQFGGGAGVVMNSFPSFKFEEPKLDPIDEQAASAKK